MAYETTAASNNPGDPLSDAGSDALSLLGWSVRPPSAAVATVTLALCALLYGLLPVLARMLTTQGMSSSAVAFYRFSLTAAVTLMAFPRARAQRSATIWAVFSGLGMAMGWVAYVEAIRLLPVATVGVIYMCYPIFTLLGSWLIFGNRPAILSVLGTGLILAAAVFAIEPGSTGSEPAATDLSIAALALALIAPLTFGVAVSILTDRLAVLDPAQRLSAVTVGGAVGLFPVLLFSLRSNPVSSVVPTDTNALVLVLGIAVATSLVPMALYTICAPLVGSARAAASGAVELPTVLLGGWIMLGEPLTTGQVVAAILIVVAVLLTPSRVTKPTSPARPDRAGPQDWELSPAPAG